MRSYFRVDPRIVENKLKDGYTPAQVGAYLMLLSQAEQQPQRGRFRSSVELRAAMDCMVEESGPAAAMAKYVPFLLNQGDVVKLGPGDPHYVDGYPYYVDGWDEWQEGNWQVAERMRRVRERKHLGGPGTPPVTRTVSRIDTPPVTSADTVPVTPPVTADVTVGVTPDVTARDARRSAAAALVPRAAASRIAVSRQQQAASEPAPLPLPLPPEVVQRATELTEGCEDILARGLEALERDLVLDWARLRRRGDLVPIEEILAVVRREMSRETPEGGLPVSLKWCRGAVATLARSPAPPEAAPGRRAAPPPRHQLDAETQAAYAAASRSVLPS